MRLSGAVLVAALCALAAGRESPAQSPGSETVGPGQTVELPPLLDSARDATREGFAFLELSAARTEYYVQQPIHLLLRFGLEEEFLRTRAVQPFGARLDVPAQVRLPWLDGVPGALALGVVEMSTAEGEAMPTFALNESVHHARHAEKRVVDGHEFRVFEFEVAFLPTSEGELHFLAPTLAFAYATHFEEGFLDGRAPVDRVDAFVSGEPLALVVRPLPEEGRPWEFTNAVGSFSVRARVAPLEISMGESMELELTIEGAGNLSAFDAPHWSDLGGFRVLGLRERKEPAARILTYELAPVGDAVWQVPGISFAFFDPEPPAGYRVVRTEPVDVVVKPEPEGVSSGEGPIGVEQTRLPPDVNRDPTDDEGTGGGAATWAWAGGLVLLALAALVVARRR